MRSLAAPIPRMPVFGWAALSGQRAPPTDTLLDLPGRLFTTSGRASILLALEGLGIGNGDKLLIPTYHCPTMVAPAVALDVEPVFYPIDAQGSPDLEWLQSQDLHDVRAMLVTHFFGLPQPMEELRAWCDARELALIEDCAHALFGRSGDRPIGAWGDVAIGSLTKFLPVPEGGCLIANRPLALRSLTDCSAKSQIKAAIDVLDEGARHGRLTGLNRLISLPLNWARARRKVPVKVPSTDVTDVPSNAKIDVELARRRLTSPSRWIADHLPLGRIVRERRRHYERLAQAFLGLAAMRPLMPTLPPDCAPYMFPLWVATPDPGYAELRHQSMPVFRWDRLWPGVLELPNDHGKLWSHHVLQIACHQDLSNRDLDLTISTLLSVYESHR